MSSKVSSPTAHLLRNSRFFSLPRPLNVPSHAHHESDSATLPYPIHQAVATTPSSLSRGDWGLKRPLPLRSTTKTNLPVFRINAMDTMEHITDFESASEHTKTLEKLQELNLPVTAEFQARGQMRGGRQRKAVFEPEADNTDPEIIRIDPNAIRWKFKGPWVAGMLPSQFNAYVKAKLKGRKHEFQAFLREECRRLLTSRRQGSRRHEDGAQEAMDESTVTEEEITNYIRELRGDFDLSSPLCDMIVKFLDLPRSAPGTTPSHSFNKVIEEGPPSTHPSAGLSYLQSDAVLSNHPLLGPQIEQKPQEARVIGSYFTERALDNQLRFGVSGVVTQGTKSAAGRRRSVSNLPHDDNLMEVVDRNSDKVGVAIQGGNRVWVAPVLMGVKQDGRIDLVVSNAGDSAIGIKTGELKAPKMPAAPRQSVLAFRDSRSAGNARSTTRQGHTNYGINDREPSGRNQSQRQSTGDPTGSIMQDLAGNIRRPSRLRPVKPQNPPTK